MQDKITNLEAYHMLKLWQCNLLKEGYIIMTQATIDKDTHIVQMRHRVNGNWIVLKVKGCEVQLWKNHSLKKMLVF